MNIFAVDVRPERAARALGDRHVIKMTLESTQILCSAAHRCGQRSPYRPTHLRHPCVTWAAERRANWDWLFRHALALAAEYRRRYGREHACKQVMVWLRSHRAGPPRSRQRRQPFAQAMPDRYRGPDPVAAYRRYYLAEKAHFATWKPPARAPRWWIAVNRESGRSGGV